MSSSRRPSEFKSPEDFRSSLEAYLQKQAVLHHKELQRYRREVAFERLLARLFAVDNSPFVLKGGCAMELRLEIARSTRDMDLVVLEEFLTEADLLHQELSRFAAQDMEDGFTFTIERMKFPLTTTLKGGGRFPVTCKIGRRPFINFTVDVALGEPIVTPVAWEEVPGKLSPFQLPSFRCRMISREQQFAEKIHAYASLRHGEQNGRTKDLVDLYLLIEEEKLDGAHLRKSLDQVFAMRDGQSPPSALASPPDSWAGRFSHMAEEVGLSCTMESAYERVAEYYDTLQVVTV
ncbi:MAG: nucleotidyl transferase AbiEii/AbiGii toxin family protein [Parachlamydiales bacterium]